MTITVIIPTYRRPEYLTRCLLSLEKQERKADAIFVVADQQDEAGREIAEESRKRGFPVITLSAPTGGVRAALNLAADRCTTDILALTDDDSEAYPDWLKKIETHFTRDAALGGVGGRDEQQYPDRPDLSNPPATDEIGHMTASGILEGRHHHPPISDQLGVDCLKGVNMALRRSALGETRIDNALRGNFAQPAWEIILSFQLRAQGWRLVFDRHLPIRHSIGPRPEDDLRVAQTLRAGAEAIFNTNYAVMSYGPLLRSLLFAVRRTVVGSRLEPGLLGLLFLIAKGDSKAWARFRNQFPAQIEGIFAGLVGWTRNSHRLFWGWPATRKDPT